MAFGGPDGELGASLRYLSQRYTAPYSQVKGLLTDIGVEELSHVEMISAIVYQLTKDLSLEEIKKSGFDTYFVDHTTGIYPISASGVPFSADTFQSCGDIITDLTEDMAADADARWGQLFSNHFLLHSKSRDISPLYQIHDNCDRAYSQTNLYSIQKTKATPHNVAKKILANQVKRIKLCKSHLHDFISDLLKSL